MDPELESILGRSLTVELDMGSWTTLQAYSGKDYSERPTTTAAPARSCEVRVDLSGHRSLPLEHDPVVHQRGWGATGSRAVTSRLAAPGVIEGRRQPTRERFIGHHPISVALAQRRTPMWARSTSA
jgi:hypothetical protein